ncbi:MAG: FAD-dependent oxidoreductase [Oscillospiraceae bacterium]|nr:FAD-dependent oxidoreductase [Oscillospiraceae bacterium]
MKKYDVIIIGGGILGCFAARNLAKYDLKAAVLEANNDVCTGISRGNTSIIYPGYDTKPGTLKTKLCVRGCLEFENLCRELDVRFEKRGSIMVAFGERSEGVLRKKLAQGVENRVPDLKLLSKEEVLTLCPDITDKVTMGLYCGNTGTVLPWELGIAAFENAQKNGVEFVFNEKVVSIRKGENYIIETERNTYSARGIVNCAGLRADEVREMLFEPHVRIVPTKGDYFVFDTGVSLRGNHIIFCEPEAKGKGLTLVPTVTGNLLAGPAEIPSEGKYDTGTTQEGIDFLLRNLKEKFPTLDTAHIIRSFSTLRPNPYYVNKNNDNSYVLNERSISNFTVTRDEEGFLSFIGIKTPGLTCCDGLGKLAADAMAEFLGAEINHNFDPVRKKTVRTDGLPFEERAELVQNSPAYGKIVCRCRGISEGEIIDAVRAGAKTLDGVKRRTEATSGRCQGSFCTERIMEIIANELCIPVSEVLKDSIGSKVLEGLL